jgi:DNA-binding NtrC family response regulator
MSTLAPESETKGTILLADDEDMVREIGTQMLKRLGFDVIGAENGRKAIDLYQENLDSVNVVILDLVMPDLGGAEAVDEIKKINPDAKIMLSSGYGRDGSTNDIMKSCSGFIQKPFSMQQLSEAIQAVIG